jgi:4'-phosphopantetheinyl transferase
MDALYFCRLSGHPDKAALLPLLSRISPEKRAVLAGLQPENRQQRLVADLLVRVLACRQTGIPNDKLRFSKNPHGKPSLEAREDFHYSISHTTGAVAVAVTDRPIGVDVEGPRRISPKLAGRFFARGEAAYVDVGTPHWERRFLRIWTQKEAYIKRLGCGLSLPSFDVTAESHAHLFYTREHEGYILSLCGEHPEKFAEMQSLSQEDVIHMAMGLSAL